MDQSKLKELSIKYTAANYEDTSALDEAMKADGLTEEEMEEVKDEMSKPPLDNDLSKGTAEAPIEETAKKLGHDGNIETKEIEIFNVLREGSKLKIVSLERPWRLTETEIENFNNFSVHVNGQRAYPKGEKKVGDYVAI